MACGIAKMIVLAVMVAEIVTPRAAVKQPEPTTVAVETTAETAPPCTTAHQDAPGGFVRYRLAGNELPAELLQALYRELDARGYAWFYKTAVCQIWQESRWNPASTNGREHGLCQQKGIFWDSRAAAAGVPGASIWDPYAQIKVYSHMMAGYLAATGGDVGRALSAYYLGTWEYSERYVALVLGWMASLEVVR